MVFRSSGRLPPAVQTVSMIGKVLDARYRILSLLGEGGMGRVFLAEHVALGSRVALKVVNEQFARQDSVMRRFQQEAIAASRIRHENIVSVTDFGRTDDGAMYFVMEYLDGESLAQLIRTSSPVPLERALKILQQLFRAMRAAHDAGIIHRDLKPENVVIVPREDGADLVKVLDFGISQVNKLEQGAERLTLAGMIMGTPEYMSPEQGAALEVDARSDIYSLGVMAYELFTGTVPFQADNQLGVLMLHQTMTPEPLRARRPELPASLERLVLRAMEKQASHRHASVAELLYELSVCGAELGLLSGTPSLPPQASLELITPGGGIPPPVVQRHAPIPLSREVKTPPAPMKPSLAPAFEAARGETMELPAAEKAFVTVGLAAPTLTKKPSFPWGNARALSLVAGLVLVLAVVGIVASRGDASRAGGAELQAPPQGVGAADAKESDQMSGTAPVVTEPATAPVLREIRTVRLASEPQGAAVYEGTLRLGVTPLEVSLANGTSATYRFTLNGRRTVTRKVAADEAEVKVQLTPAEPSRKRVGSGLKESPYEDLKPNPF